MVNIKNLEEIAFTRPRAHVIALMNYGILAAAPELLMPQYVGYDRDGDILYLKGMPLHLRGKRVFVIGGGKASAEMALALERILGPDRITDGVVTCVVAVPTTKVTAVEAGHPIPDRRGQEAVERMLALKDRYGLDERDVVICLISGGGSALMPSPIEGLELEELAGVTSTLIGSGATINEINCVRKHLSRTKGGRLGDFFRPAKVVSLIISDVVGNDKGSIASGPTVPDQTTFKDAWSVLEKYGLVRDMPERVLEHFQDGLLGRVKDTPRGLNNCQNHIIGDISTSLNAIFGAARDMGHRPRLLTSRLGGPPDKAANTIALDIALGKFQGYDILIAGGETTPRLPKVHGKGGRNMHFTAVSLRALEGLSMPFCMASVCTDGTDFLSDIGGAIIDQDSLGRAREERLDVDGFIREFDTYTLFKKMGKSLVETGDTGTNVGDMVIYHLG